MKFNLKNLAIMHSQGKVTDAAVKVYVKKLKFPEVKREAGETWYEGNPDNTIAAVQALIGSKITQEDFNKFTELM